MAGKIDISRLKNPPEKHEFLVAKIFSEQDKDVVFIPASNISGVHQPDFIIDNLKWELKSPKGNSKRTLQNNIHKAQMQSRNIIIDLHRIKLDEQKCISQIAFEFEKRKSINRILIVTKKNKILDLKRNK